MRMLDWLKDLIPEYESDPKGKAEGRRVRMKDQKKRMGKQVSPSFVCSGILYAAVLWEDSDTPEVVNAEALQREEPIWRDIA